ncbi:unnamed protein product [Brassica napus]|uniref:(rape) hypothetical protein n=1 Tax=Brassica napus TaxID=3708 RepID=A0A816SM78_BRANA|nr:unnamed protein product [Brassica napus]
MKNERKCDTWCELQNPVNHRVFERKLRPKPSGRGHACLATDRAQVPWKGAPERVRAPVARTLSHHEALSTSRVVWECSPNRAVNSVQG